MTATPDAAGEIELTPTEGLVLDVLGARHRLGEQLWTFDSRLSAAVRRLADRSLIVVMHGVVEHTFRARLTQAGIDQVLLRDYTPPTQRPHRRQARRDLIAHAVAGSFHAMQSGESPAPLLEPTEGDRQVAFDVEQALHAAEATR